MTTAAIPCMGMANAINHITTARKTLDIRRFYQPAVPAFTLKRHACSSGSV